MPKSLNIPVKKPVNPKPPISTPSPTPIPKSQKISKEEVEVLRLNSKINGKVFVPFEPRDVTSDALGGNGKWSDPDGLLGQSCNISYPSVSPKISKIQKNL